MADLAERVDSRRVELGPAAEANPSAHVIRLLGPPGRYGTDRQRWLTNAGALEAYREQWRVEPDQLGREPHLQGAQALEWAAVRSQLSAGMATPEWSPRAA